MTTTNTVGGSQGSTWSPATSDTTASPRVTGGDTVVPPSGGGADDGKLILTMPTIPPPKVGGLSLEMLVKAVGMEERATATKAGVESIKAKAQEREELNDKKMEEIKKNLEDMKSKGVLDIFLKAFKIIGAALGAITAAATVALGVATGNPLLIAAGSIMAFMTINSIASVASDGVASISNGISAAVKACGGSDELAQWLGFAIEISISLVACGLTLGAASSSSIAQMVDSSSNVIRTASQVTVTAVGVSGLTTVMQGVTQGVGAYYDYNISMSKADQREFAAMLEKLQEAIAMEQDFMKAIIERSSELIGKVGEIVQENAAAQTAVLGGSAPSMA